MATLVYALCGTGRGHVSRAIAMATTLRARGHRVVFAAGAPNAADLPGETFGIPALRQVVQGNRVRLGATARANSATARYSLDTIEAAARWLRLVGADAVVADHEPFVGRAARRLGMPVVSLSRQMILVEALHEAAPGEAASAWATARGIAFLAPRRPDAVVVPTFAPPVPRPESRARFVPPILRDDVLEARSTSGGRVLVYVNEADGMDALLETLGRVDAPFDVFGFAPGVSAPANVRLCTPGRSAFLERLAASRAVVATAGFTLLSEALHLGKPVLALPNHGFFEQAVNARAVVRMGSGEALWNRTLHADDVSGFLSRASAYACPPATVAAGRAGREAAADAVEAVLRGHSGLFARFAHPQQRGPAIFGGSRRARALMTHSDLPGRPTTPDASARASIFAKAERFFEPDGDYAKVTEAGLYPFFRAITVSEGSTAIMNGREVIMAGSNNYLGLTNDLRVQEAAQAAIRKYGTGCTGSRFLNGTLDLHLELEARLAAYMGKEACVLFSTGYMTNQGVVQSIAGKGDLIFSDKDNHACIIAGQNVSLAETVRYRHNDMAHLRARLEAAVRDRPEAGRLIVTDGVFSMSGTLADVPALVALSKEFDAALVLDDAHAVGVIGPGGRGSAAVFGLTDDVDLITGTFSKSFASLGGFVVGDATVIDYIRHSASTHIFSASMPPANVATALACLDILEQEPERLDRLAEISDFMRTGFRTLGFDVWASQTPIIPVVIGEMYTCFRFWKDLLEAGVFSNPVIPPAVPRGQALMRTSYMASHTDTELERVLEAFRVVGLRHGIITADGQMGPARLAAMAGINGQHRSPETGAREPGVHGDSG